MFNIKGDLKPLTRSLTDIQKKQIPFAVSRAINDTLFDIQKAEKAQMPKKLDNPTPYTLKAFKINKAKKKQLVGDIHVMPQKYKYLKYAIEGGSQTGSVPVPYTRTGNIKLNKYGNIIGRKNGLVKKKSQFIGKVKGITGVWERGHISKKGNFTTVGKSRSTNLRLLIGFKPVVNYKPRFPFYKIADGVARRKFIRHMSKSLKLALRSAK
tara:strand:- start:42 stop:671 length:630 start_codon:yes stop_codon:yes gene_type:complete